MKLYERFGDSGFHTSIMTTFGIDFDAYENIVLPRLRGGGCFNNILLADRGMLNYALDGASALPKHAGRHYTVSGVAARAVFHPKITVQVGRRRGRVIVASANVTASGLAGNFELAGLVECSAERTGEQRIVAAALKYARSLCDTDQESISHQLEWMRARAPWLIDAEPADGPVALSDGSIAALFIGGEGAIGSRFSAVVDDRPVKRLVVISPYWDTDLSALRFLTEQLKPKEVAVLIDREKQLFPPEGLRHLPEAVVYNLEDFAQNRFVHAKAIVIETATADHVLYGSANCTIAALGASGTSGTNDEVCLYRRLPPGAAVDTLSLASTLASTNRIATSDIPPLSLAEEIPLEDAAKRSAGRFECIYDTLIWWPPVSMREEPITIELLDAQNQPLTSSIARLSGGLDNRRRFQISGTSDRPNFARLRFADGSVSTSAAIMVVDLLRESIKEARNKRAESAATQLSEETEESLWLIEILNELEVSEASLNSEDPGAKRTRERSPEVPNPDNYRTLSYEEFVAGRHLRSDERGVVRNSLSGSEISLVRSFLNRILAIHDPSGGAPDPFDEDALRKGLDLGDETADGEGSLEQGEELPGQSIESARDADEKEAQARRSQARATRAQIVSAVERFNERMRAKSEAGELSASDVLRLRALLMIVARAGQPIADSKDSPKLSSLQVLRLDDGDDGWPKLVGRVLFAFFGGKRPAIRNVRIEAVHDQIPDDILECWATCLWCAQACVSAAEAHPGLRRTVWPMLMALRRQTYALTGLRENELHAPPITTVYSGLNERFAKRLGFSADAMHQAHQSAGTGTLAVSA